MTGAGRGVRAAPMRACGGGPGTALTAAFDFE